MAVNELSALNKWLSETSELDDLNAQVPSIYPCLQCAAACESLGGRSGNKNRERRDQRSRCRAESDCCQLCLVSTFPYWRSPNVRSRYAVVWLPLVICSRVSGRYGNVDGKSRTLLRNHREGARGRQCDTQSMPMPFPACAFSLCREIDGRNASGVEERSISQSRCDDEAPVHGSVMRLSLPMLSITAIVPGVMYASRGRELRRQYAPVSDEHAAVYREVRPQHDAVPVSSHKPNR